MTIPSNFLAPLGRLIHWRYGVPFGIDYQDPWVNVWPGVERKGSRAWWSYMLATWLEPWSVRDAALITGMAPGYVAGMLERNPDVGEECRRRLDADGHCVGGFRAGDDACTARRSCSIRPTATST